MTRFEQDVMLFWVSLVAFLLFLVMAASAHAEPLEGLATYYTVASCQREGTSGVWTASGEAYDEQALTAALPWKPDRRRYRVCRRGSSNCVVIRHNDRGPGRRARARGVVIDLTPAAFDALGGTRGCNQRGVCWGEIAVTVEPL